MSNQATASKPTAADLYPHYKAFVHPETSNRINALWEAVDWWTKRMEWHLRHATFTPDQAKCYQRATAMRNQAMGTKIVGEQETALYQAVRQYEKVDGNVATEETPEEERKGKITSISFFLAKLKDTNDDMLAAIQKKSSPYKDTITTLNTYFAPLKVTYRVTEQTEEVKIHSAEEISVSFGYADKLRDLFVSGSIASLVLNQVNRVLMVRAIDNGKLDLPRLVKDIPHVLTFLGKALDGAKLRGWQEAGSEEAEAAPAVPEPTAAAAPPTPPPPPPPPPSGGYTYSSRRSRFSRRGKANPAASSTTTSTPGTAKSSPVPTSFRKGTAMALLYEFMEEHDGQTVAMADLIHSMGDTVNAPGGRILAMAKIGRQNGLWSLDFHKGSQTATISIAKGARP